MDLTRLAARQKRWKDISSYTNEVLDPAVKKALQGALAAYHTALAESWQNPAPSTEDEIRLASLERDLERLHTDARLLAGQKHTTYAN